MAVRLSDGLTSVVDVWQVRMFSLGTLPILALNKLASQLPNTLG